MTFQQPGEAWEGVGAAKTSGTRKQQILRLQSRRGRKQVDWRCILGVGLTKEGKRRTGVRLTFWEKRLAGGGRRQTGRALGVSRGAARNQQLLGSIKLERSVFKYRKGGVLGQLQLQVWYLGERPRMEIRIWESLVCGKYI